MRHSAGLGGQNGGGGRRPQGCAGAYTPLSPRRTNRTGRPMADTQFDVLTIGNAIVDVIAPIDPAFLAREGMAEGIMHLVDAARSAYLYERMPLDKRQISGGSSANTAAVVASYGGRAAGGGGGAAGPRGGGGADERKD